MCLDKSGRQREELATPSELFQGGEERPVAIVVQTLLQRGKFSDGVCQPPEVLGFSDQCGITDAGNDVLKYAGRVAAIPFCQQYGQRSERAGQLPGGGRARVSLAAWTLINRPSARAHQRSSARCKPWG